MSVTLSKSRQIVSILDTVTHCECEGNFDRDRWEKKQKYLASRLLNARQWKEIHGLESLSLSQISEASCQCGRVVLFEFIHRKKYILCFDCDLLRQKKVAADWRERNRSKPSIRTCDHCGETYEPKRSGSKFCCDKCRVYASRAAKIGGGE